jgi:hypothetical protein
MKHTGAKQAIMAAMLSAEPLTKDGLQKLSDHDFDFCRVPNGMPRALGPLLDNVANHYLVTLHLPAAALDIHPGDDVKVQERAIRVIEDIMKENIPGQRKEFGIASLTNNERVARRIRPFKKTVKHPDGVLVTMTRSIYEGMMYDISCKLANPAEAARIFGYVSNGDRTDVEAFRADLGSDQELRKLAENVVTQAYGKGIPGRAVEEDREMAASLARVMGNARDHDSFEFLALARDWRKRVGMPDVTFEKRETAPPETQKYR